MTDESGSVSFDAELPIDADRLWSVVRSFGDVSKWNPIAVDSRLVAGLEGEVGAERAITTADHQTARERLVEFDDDARRLAYRMLTFPIPVREQSNTITVARGQDDAHSRITFASQFVTDGATTAEVADINRSAFAAAAQGLARYFRVADV